MHLSSVCMHMCRMCTCTCVRVCRYLIDAGCVFVGHDLRKDWRLLNVVVPQPQVIDTSELLRYGAHGCMWACRTPPSMGMTICFSSMTVAGQ